MFAMALDLTQKHSVSPVSLRQQSLCVRSL